MSAPEKAEVVTKVSSSPLPKRKVLRELGIPKSTYYRWLRRQNQQGLEDRPGGDQPPWNRLTIQEERSVLLSAREMPELSCRQLAAWITDNQGFSVSESSVYRILGREGLVKRPEMRLAAGKEYHRKTTGPHQMWATDASYFRVVGWGYYYLVTVMDDYSRFILAHRLQQDMTADSFIEVVQDAVDTTSMDQVPVTDRTRLLSDNGPGYVSRAFRDYLGMVGIKHILATPFHPQTNGKLERYHQTIKRDVNQVPYELPADLEAAISAFVSYYNYRRHHDPHGPPAGAFPLPLVEAIGQDQAPSSLQRSAEAGPLGQGLGASVYHAATHRCALGPGRYQSPPHVGAPPSAAVSHGEGHLGRGNVVAGNVGQFRVVKSEPLLQLSYVRYQAVSSTHLRSVGKDDYTSRFH